MYLTKNDICAVLKISNSTLERLIASQEFPAPERFGKRILRWRSDVLDQLPEVIETLPVGEQLLLKIDSVITKTPGGSRQVARDLGLSYTRLKQLIAGSQMTLREHERLSKREAELVDQTTIFAG